MRRKFKKTVTMLASLTISVAQIQTPAMADVSVKKNIASGQTEENNAAVIDTNNGTVVNNDKKGVIEDNNNLVETNYGVIKENNEGAVVEKNNEGGVVEHNNENAQVTLNLGTINVNEGEVGGSGKNTVNHGTIKDNQADLELNAGAEDGEMLDLPDYEGATIESNSAVISINNGIIGTNEADGDVIENNGRIGINLGTVKTNTGEIELNKETVEGNYDGGIIYENSTSGHIEVNGEDSSVEKNYGQIDENQEDGTVNLNTGYIDTNSGTIGVYEEVDEKTEGDFYHHTDDGNFFVDSYSGNYGNIDTNEESGIISYNAGTADKEKLSGEMGAPEEVSEEFAGGTVSVNKGLIIVNNGTVEANNGTVGTNLQDGVVANHKGGIVNKNEGKVYNYGGTVTDKSTGTEYFSVLINSGNNIRQTGGNNLESYEDEKWLGQKGNTQSNTEIILTPSSDYYISDISIPKSLKDYVSVNKNTNGTWTISIKSGMNISLNVNALYNNSGSDDDHEDSDTKKSGSDNNKNNNSLTINLTDLSGNHMQIKDNNGNHLNMDLSKVLIHLSDKTLALNSFNSPMGIDPNDIQGFGKVNLSAIFNETNASEVSIPVGASVKAGTTYMIAFTDGTTKEVKCEIDGILMLPVEQGTGELTFIIYGKAPSPAGPGSQANPEPVKQTQPDSNNTPLGPVDDIGFHSSDIIDYQSLTAEALSTSAQIQNLPVEVQTSKNNGTNVDLNSFNAGLVSVDSGAHSLYGGAGNDEIWSHNHDVIINGYGTDSVYGGAGEDILHGGAGNDIQILNSIDSSQNGNLYEISPANGGFGADTISGLNISQQAQNVAANGKDTNTMTFDGQLQNSQAKSVVETRAATTAFINAGADMLASQGFQQAADSTALESDSSSNKSNMNSNTGGFTPFAAFNGGSLRAETG